MGLPTGHLIPKALYGGGDSLGGLFPSKMTMNSKGSKKYPYRGAIEGMSSGQRYVLETEPAGMKKRCRCSFLLMLKGWELSPKRRELQRVTGCEGLKGERGKTLQRNHLLPRKGANFAIHLDQMIGKKTCSITQWYA